MLDQSSNIAGEAIVLDRGRRLPKVVTVLDPLSKEGRLGCIVMERCSRGVQVWEGRWVKYRLKTGVALSDVDNVPLDVIDRTADVLAEICPQYWGIDWRVCILDRCNLFVELIDDDVRVQIGEIVDPRHCIGQHLLHADKV